MPSPRLVGLAVAAICYIGLVANQAYAEALAQGRWLVDPEVAPPVTWQFLREGATLLLLLVLWLGCARIRRRDGAPWVVALPLLAALGVLAVLFARTLLFEQQTLTGAVTGLRLVYISLIALCIRYYDTDGRQQLLRALALGLTPLLLIETYLAGQQVLNAPPTVGATFLGARPWGTYFSPNNLGLAMLAFAIVVIMARRRYWRTLTAVAGLTCLATGSRTAIIGFVLVLVGAALAKFRSRWLLLPVLGAMAYAVYNFASSSAVSGRTIRGESRLETWSAVWSHLRTWPDRLFGAGVGAGSNAQSTLLGSAERAGFSITDSVWTGTVLSLGLLGVLVVAVVYAWLWGAVAFEYRFLILPALGLAALSFNVPEVAPFNLLVAVAIGCALPPRPGVRRRVLLPARG